MNQLGGEGLIDFGAQMTDINIDNVSEPLKTSVPYVLDDHGARNDPSGLGGQILQQHIFFGGKLNPLSTALDLLSQAVDLKVGNAKRVVTVSRRTPQQGL